MQGGEECIEDEELSERKKEKEEKKKKGGNIALGILLLLLAYLVYPTNVLVALGVGVLGLYLILGGRL